MAETKNLVDEIIGLIEPTEDGTIIDDGLIISQLPEDLSQDDFKKSLEYLSDFTKASRDAVKKIGTEGDAAEVAASFTCGDELTIEHIYRKKQEIGGNGCTEANYTVSSIQHHFEWERKLCNETAALLEAESSDE